MLSLQNAFRALYSIELSVHWHMSHNAVGNVALSTHGPFGRKERESNDTNLLARRVTIGFVRTHAHTFRNGLFKGFFHISAYFFCLDYVRHCVPVAVTCQSKQSILQYTQTWAHSVAITVDNNGLAAFSSIYLPAQSSVELLRLCFGGCTLLCNSLSLCQCGSNVRSAMTSPGCAYCSQSVGPTLDCPSHVTRLFALGFCCN